MSLLALISLFLPVIILIFAVVFVISIVGRMQRRADQRLELEKQRTSLLQQQLEEINNRLTTIESMLKEVD